MHDLAPAITCATGMRWSDELSDLVYQYCTLRMRVRVRRARTASRPHHQYSPCHAAGIDAPTLTLLD
jgi:hypothetical protein